MQGVYEGGENFQVSEMAIVDAFTKLIFGQEEDYGSQELLIIQAFREVDANVFRDSHVEMGEYLRELGVREMIQLVGRVREYMHSDINALAGDSVDSIPVGPRSKSVH